LRADTKPLAQNNGGQFDHFYSSVVVFHHPNKHIVSQGAVPMSINPTTKGMSLVRLNPSDVIAKSEGNFQRFCFLLL